MPKEVSLPFIYCLLLCGSFSKITIISIFVICSDFLTDEKTGEPLVKGNWPPAEEVAEECIVEEVAQWWSSDLGEEEVLCETCHEEHLAASRKKRRKMLGGDKVSSREYKNRTELSSGYYTKQSWVSSKFKALLR